MIQSFLYITSSSSSIQLYHLHKSAYMIDSGLTCLRIIIKSASLDLFSTLIKNIFSLVLLIPPTTQNLKHVVLYYTVHLPNCLIYGHNDTRSSNNSVTFFEAILNHPSKWFKKFICCIFINTCSN